jgi:Domain of unknown function DUF29
VPQCGAEWSGGRAGDPATQLKPSAKDLYERDYYAWTLAQATELRRLAKRRTHGALDLEHLAEEVADLGHSERDAVRSQVRRIIEHRLKLESTPAVDPRDGWKDTIADARSIVADKLSPSLRLDLEAMLASLYVQVLPKARRALRRFGEHEAARTLPAVCPYALDDLARPEWYPSNRHGIADEDTE